MKTKRKLIFEDQTYPAYLEKSAKPFRPHLEKVKEAYEELEIGTFTDEVLKEFITRGTSRIGNDYETKIETNLKKAGLSTASKTIMADCREKTEKLSQAVRELNNFHPMPGAMELRPQIRVENLSFIDGEFVVSPEDQEKIIEANGRIYLSSEKEHQLYNDLQSLIAAFEKVNETLEDAEAPTMDSFSGLQSRFLKTTNGNYGIIPQSINGILTHNQRRKEWEERKRSWAEA